MKLNKRKKSRRFHGSRLWGRAAKKSKGSGNRGGKGMAGTGKRADQRKTYVLKYHFPYFGKRGFTSRSTAKNNKKSINLRAISEKLNRFIKSGRAKKSPDGMVIDLSKYKILGDGEISEKFIIKAYDFSSSAREKIEKAGGKCEALKKQEDNKE